MPLAIGTRIGVYEIAAPLGEGGMGEVYRARDNKLQRDVAIKVLPEAVAEDGERLARLEREARTLAALNHPHIAQVHGFETAGTVQALVMELVDGPTLAERIAHGPVPLDDALPIASQIAEALEAAHEQGIIHRDLKPANIKVRPDGTVKVLDFGLAKALEPAGAAHGNVTLSPTITTPAMTQAGVILGTAAYMSPEQAKGRPADKRSDIWAFGCVLYEMLTGRRAFDGEDMTDVLGAVVRLEPDWTALPPDVPPAIRTLLQRCLVKDRRRRVGDVAAVLFVLNNVASLVAGTNAAESDAAVSTASVEVRRWRRRTGWIAAAALVLVGAAIGISVWRMPRPIPVAVTRAAIVLTPDLPVSGQGVALSPDGRTLAIPAGNRLVLRSLDREDARPLPGSDGATLPFFSPDGAWVGYVANGELRKIRIDGTTPRTISKALGVFTPPWWAADDTILFSVLGTGLFRVPAAGGTPELFTEARRDEGEITHGWPQMLPGGRTVLFTVTRASGSTAAVLPLDSRAWRILPQITGSSAMYVPSGHLVFVSGDTFFAAPFDPASATVTGMAVPVSDRVERTFAIARDGTMAFLVREQPPSTGYQGVIVASDREGSLSMVRGQEIVTIQGASGGGMSFSPDGTRFAAGLRVPGNDSNRSHLWSYDLARGTRVQLTDRGPINAGPKWSVDGSRVAFTSTRETPGIYVQSPDPGSPVTLLLPRRQNVQSPQSLGSDSSLIYVEADPRTGFDVWVRDSHGATRTLLATPANERSPRLSSDGRWLAYASDVSGQSEVYVRPYPGPGRTEVVSNTGGSEPRWAGSRELIYRRGREVVAVPMVASGDAIAPGQPHVLFEIDDHPLNYDVSSDGTKFLFLQRADDNESIPAQVTLMLNWFEELKRLVPAK